MPDALISWTRLQAGRVRDPLVASHVLAGIASQIIFASLVRAVEWGRNDGLASRDIAALNGMGDFAASLLSVQAPLIFSVILVGLTVLLHTVLRRVWLTHLVVATAFGMIAGLDANGVWDVRETVLGTLQLLVPLALMQRFGYLSLLAAALTRATLLVVPPVLDAWYTGRFVFTLAVVAAVAAWCVWVITTEGERARERYA